MSAAVCLFSQAGGVLCLYDQYLSLDAMRHTAFKSRSKRCMPVSLTLEMLLSLCNWSIDAQSSQVVHGVSSLKHKAFVFSCELKMGPF